MALQKDITLSGSSIMQTELGRLETGSESKILSSAYIKVESVDATKDNATAYVSIVSGESKLGKKYKFIPSVADDASNFIKQAYIYLKTLPEFAGSTDV